MTDPADAASLVAATTRALTGGKVGGTALLSHLSGVHRAQISMVERGKRPLTRKQAAKIAAGLRDHASRCEGLAVLVEMV